MIMKKRLASVLFMVTAAGLAVGLSVSSAVADTTIHASYPVNGSTYIKATNSTMALGPGSLTATVDLTTGSVTGNVSLPPATGSFAELGLVPVTATTEFIQDGQTTGAINKSTGALQATSQITLKLTDLKIEGLDVPIGNSCQSTTPATITVTSSPGFSPLKGGTVTGTYTIPPFRDCLLLTPLINLTIPGPDNTISLTLGTPTFG
jgi:hypothetical protein